jgi:hypothetical protein
MSVIDLSQPRFHELLFSPVACNVMQGQSVSKSTAWHVKSKEAVASKFGQLLPTDVDNAVFAKEAGCCHGTEHGVQFANLGDAVASFDCDSCVTS